MKALIVTALALALSACSSTATKQPANAEAVAKTGVTASRFAETAFDSASGNMNMVFDDQGNWVKITAKGTASLGEDTPSARETALIIATMRAKRSIAEFLNNDIKSTKTMSRIARSYARAFQSEDVESTVESMSGLDMDAISDLDIDGTDARSEKSREAHRFASILTERIQDNSAAILKGVYISHRSLQDSQAIVELTATRQSVTAAHQMFGMMRGTPQ